MADVNMGINRKSWVGGQKGPRIFAVLKFTYVEPSDLKK